MMRQMRRGGGMPGMPGMPGLRRRRQEGQGQDRAAAAQGQGQVGQPGQAGPAGARGRAAGRGGPASGAPGGAVRAGAGGPGGGQRPSRVDPSTSTCRPASRSSSAAEPGSARASQRRPRPASACAGGDVLHLRGRVLVGPDDERAEAWVVGGRITYEAPPAATGDGAATSRAGCCPGWSTRTATSGSTPHGAVDAATQEQQARDRPRRRRAAAARRRLARRTPAGSTTARTCRGIVRAGRHIARPERYIRDFAPRDRARASWPTYVRARGPAAATAGSSSSATGSTATSATSRPCWPPAALRGRRSRPPTRRAPG